MGATVVVLVVVVVGVAVVVGSAADPAPLFPLLALPLLPLLASPTVRGNESVKLPLINQGFLVNWLTSYIAMTHVLIPLLVVGILDSVSTSPVINCCFVCIGVEDVDVPKPSTHFDRAISSTAISTLYGITGSLWTRVGTYALRAILKASIVIASCGTESHTPKSKTFLRTWLL